MTARSRLRAWLGTGPTAADRRRFDDLDRRLADMDRGLHELLGGLRDDLRLQVERLRVENDALRAELAESEARSGRRAEELSEAVRGHAQRHAEEVGALAVERTAARIGRLERTVRALAGAAPSPGAGAAPAPPAAVARSDGDGAGSVIDPISYGAFEDEMRGPSSVVRELQREYLPDLAALGRSDLPILDVGCGRGEFLALVREAGMAVEGLDINPDFVEECREAGFVAEVGDAVTHLLERDEGSLRAVTAFHVVEHLPMAEVTRFLAAAHRAVAPGGGLLLETPDPANLAVGAHRFWFDPTHLRPVPSPLLAFLARDAGFEDVVVRRLHPLEPAVDPAATRDPVVAQVAAVLNDALAGPVDYLLLARRP